MLTIRLQRTGTKNKPSFRIVLAQSYRSASKQALEVLGHYNPTRKDFAIKDAERLNYWIAQHVAISPTVHNLLVEKKMLAGKKVKAWHPKKKEGGAAVAPATQATPVAEKPAVTSEASTTPTSAETPVETPAVEPQA